MSRIRILVDTNVWLDEFLDGRPGNRASRILLDAALAHEALLFYASESLKDVFYLVSHQLKADCRAQTGHLNESQARAANDAAWACVLAMRETATAVGCDESDLWLACKYRALHSDLEDNLVLAAAERAKADFLVTNDSVLLRKSTVPAHTSEDALALLNIGC